MEIMKFENNLKSVRLVMAIGAFIPAFAFAQNVNLGSGYYTDSSGYYKKPVGYNDYSNDYRANPYRYRDLYDGKYGGDQYGDNVYFGYGVGVGEFGYRDWDDRAWEYHDRDAFRDTFRVRKYNRGRNVGRHR